MNLTRLENTLYRSNIIDAIKSVCPDGAECFLVGGAIRDCIADRELNDFDFCCTENPTAYAKSIAEKLGATWFVLDEERGHSRFVLKQGSDRLTCDFAPFRAPSLESDLHKRDFTINAMAMSCTSDKMELIDPLCGRDDLEKKILRSCSEYSFQEDPLRCLKGVRHAVSMELEFDPETIKLLIDSVPQIDQVASERIRSELSRSIACQHPVKAFELLGFTGLHKELFGPSSPESFSIALDLLRDLEKVLKALRSGTCGQVVADYLADSCEENVTINVALNLATFFYGYRPVALKSVLNALRFSKRTISLIEQLQGLSEATVISFDQVANKARSRARWLAGLGREPLASAIFMPLISSETVQENLLRSELLIDSYNSCAVHGKLRELVDGGWLTEATGGAEGPEIGRLLGMIHQAEISGEATTTKEAQQWLLAKQKSIDNEFE